MSPILLYHATSRRNRESILTHGLRADLSLAEPPGVYAFDPHMVNGVGSTAARCGWASGPTSDLWRIVYCGPMRRDLCLINAVILPSVTSVTLVTGNDK